MERLTSGLIRVPYSGQGTALLRVRDRAIVPTEGRPYVVEVAGTAGDRVLFGKTVHDVKSRVVALRATIEAGLDDIRSVRRRGAL